MPGRYPAFDRSQLRLRPLSERVHDLSGDFILPLDAAFKTSTPAPPGIKAAAAALDVARRSGAARLFLCGAHVIRAGVQRFLFDLMARGYVNGVAVNGACVIHDFEIALIGATTESVARYIQDGRFGLWRETGRLNRIITEGWEEGLGIGEAVGREIADGDYPHKDKSLFAAAWNLGLPVTVHVGIGHDIIHEHPDFDPAATGAASYRDFLILAALLETLSGGCVCTFGSAVMAPEIFLKALAMVRNVAAARGENIENFTSLVCDLHELPETPSKEAAKDDPRYYFRPWKTLLARTISGGASHYVRGWHNQTIPALWRELAG